MMMKTLFTLLLATLCTASYADAKGGLEKAWMKPKKDGDKVPNVIFKTRTRIPDDGTDNPFDWKDLTSEDYFKGKRTIVFSLPGAFTPTCKCVTVWIIGYVKLFGLFKPNLPSPNLNFRLRFSLAGLR
jgi:hypothetical protein